MDNDKSEIYEQEISPFMKQIIEVCKEHKIGMVASFHTGGIEGVDKEYQTVNSALTSNEYNVPIAFNIALQVIEGNFDFHGPVAVVFAPGHKGTIELLKDILKGEN